MGVWRFVVDGTARPSQAPAAEPAAGLYAVAFPEVAGWLRRSALLSPRSWGGLYAEDPWPALLPGELPTAVEAELAAQLSAQAPGGIPRHSFRLLTPAGAASESVVSVEDHEEVVVLELVAERLDVLVPLLAGSGLRLRSVEELEGDVGRAEQIAGDETTDGPDAVETLRAGRAAILGVGAILHGELRLLDRLRQLGAHGRRELRAAVIAVASRIGYRLFLLELLAGESDRQLQRVLTSVTTPSPEAEGSA